MLFSKLGAMFRQVSEQQAGRQAVHLFLAVATAGQRGLSWVTERERRAGVCVVFHRFGDLQHFCVSQGWTKCCVLCPPVFGNQLSLSTRAMGNAAQIQ